jgi:hypothetical protein
MRILLDESLPIELAGIGAARRLLIRYRAKISLAHLAG